MKQITAVLLLFTIFFSCKKQGVISHDDYLEQVKKSLADSLSPADYASLDFPRALAGRIDSVGFYYIKIPVKVKKPGHDLIMATTTAAGSVKNGKFVHLEGNVKYSKWEGSIVISSLGRKSVLASPIQNGYITALHTQNNLRTTVQPDEDVMPEVIICYTIDSGTNWTAWMQIQSFFYDVPSDVGYSYFTQLGGSGGGGGTTAGASQVGPGINAPGYEQPMQVDADNYSDDPAIDIEKYIACFDKIPDAGATCSIEIFADIPVDTDPNKIFDISSGSPGHCFIQLKKSNGAQGVMQNLGFYPKTGFKVGLTNAPVDAKFVDDGGHEFNASLKMNLTPEDMRSTLMGILQFRNMQYDIDDFNCTDWALNIFNKTRIHKLKIPVYDIPGNIPSTGTEMPQGLYNKLKEMKDVGDPEAANITIDILKGWVASSTGPCN